MSARTRILPAMLLLAAPAFAFATEAAPASGDPAALVAAGNAAWRAGDPGHAVLDWERALLLEPRRADAFAGLAVAAHEGAKAPVVTAVESYAGVLRERDWTLLACAAFWLAVLVFSLPFVTPLKRRGAHHAIVALALTILLLTAPGVFGSHRIRARGVILRPDTALLLSPTATGERIASFAPGDRVRLAEVSGKFRAVVTADGTRGWVDSAAIATLIPGG